MGAGATSVSLSMLSGRISGCYRGNAISASASAAWITKAAIAGQRFGLRSMGVDSTREFQNMAAPRAGVDGCIQARNASIGLDTEGEGSVPTGVSAFA
jgi:hypothetical protein